MLAYNGFSGALAVWEKQEQETYEFLENGAPANLGDRAVQNLMYGGYVVKDQVDELTLLQQQYNGHRFNPGTMTLTIAPTLDCNFGCDYCFQGKDKPVDVMSMEVQDAIIGLVERAASGIKQLGIAWYGGEPLLRPKIIEALSDRLISVCDRHGISYTAMMVSNGYRLDVEVAKSLYRRRVKTLQVTLDGTPEYHDQRRVLLSGKETFEKIVENLKAVVDAVPMMLSIRVNIDHRNREQIKQLLDILAERGLGQRKNFKVYFAPVEAMTQGCHLVEDMTMGKSDYGQLEAELYRYGFEKGLTQLPYPPRFHGTCAAVKPKGLVIIPSGNIHKCWDTVNNPLYAVGNIFDIDALKENQLMQEWLKWTPFDNDTCRNCKILPNCAGACAYKFIHSEDTRGEAAVLPCPSWKYNIKERLLLRAVKMGAITLNDYDPEAVKTQPSELCADVHRTGKALPDKMAAMYALAAR
jgi:uncharacterized protein